MQLPQRIRPARVPPWLLITLVLLGLLGYSATIGAFLGMGRNTISLLLIAIPIGILIVILIVQHFELAVLLLPLTTLAIPIDLPTGTSSRVPISLALTLLLAVIWCISMSLRRWKLAQSPLNRPLLAFGAVCIISLIWDQIWRDPVLIYVPRFIIIQIGSLASFLLSICAALLIGNFVITERRLKFVVGLFIGFCSLMTFTQLFHIPQHFLNDRGLWGTWLIAPAYGLLIAQPRVAWYWRAALVVLLLATLYQNLIVNSIWLSGWVPSLFTIGVATFLHSRKAFLIFVAAAAIAGVMGKGFLDMVVQENVNEGSAGRVGLWEHNLELIRSHWLFGTGPAGYALYYMTYNPDTAAATHNNYFDIVAQFGIVGILAWLWLSVVSMWEGWTLVRRAPPGFPRTMAIIATSGWAGALVAMFSRRLGSAFRLYANNWRL